MYRSVQSIDIHGPNSIGLAKLSTPLSFSDYVRPVCLPAKDTTIPSPTLCEVTSWRATTADEEPSLQGSAVPIIRDPCFPERSPGVIYDYRPAFGHNLKRAQNSICAGAFRSAMGCDLDRGAPLVCSVHDRATISGLLANTPNCGREEEPLPEHNEFVKVAKFSQWIAKRLSL